MGFLQLLPKILCAVCLSFSLDFLCLLMFLKVYWNVLMKHLNSQADSPLYQETPVLQRRNGWGWQGPPEVFWSKPFAQAGLAWVSHWSLQDALLYLENFKMNAWVWNGYSFGLDKFVIYSTSSHHLCQFAGS